jgi:hypothetical protein
MHGNGSWINETLQALQILPETLNFERAIDLPSNTPGGDQTGAAQFTQMPRHKWLAYPELIC